MYINSVASKITNDRNNNKIAFGDARELNVAKKMTINFIEEQKEILQSGNRSKIGENLLNLKNNLIEKILNLNPGSRTNQINKEMTLIYDKKNKYIGSISQIPSGKFPINVDYFDSAMKKFVGVDITPCEILGNSHARYVEKSVE